MCDAVMCENIAAHSQWDFPLYFITRQQQRSPVFLQRLSEAQSDQPRFSFAHISVFYRSICIFLFYVPHGLIGFFHARHTAKAVCSQQPNVVSCHGSHAAVVAIFLQNMAQVQFYQT